MHEPTARRTSENKEATRESSPSFSFWRVQSKSKPNAEIPRNAVLMATIPRGTDNAVMLVASSNASQWRREGGQSRAMDIVDSFRAVPAPKTSLKLRAKDRSGGSSLDF